MTETQEIQYVSTEPIKKGNLLHIGFAIAGQTEKRILGISDIYLRPEKRGTRTIIIEFVSRTQISATFTLKQIAKIVCSPYDILKNVWDKKRLGVLYK